MGTLRGRVVNVRSRGDGTYGVTCIASAAAKEFLWMLSQTPPRLGALLEIDEASTRRFSRDGASVTLVEGGSTSIIPDKWARRFVPQPWLVAVQRACRIPLFPHQIEGAGWLAERLAHGKGSLLCDDPGLGKTLQMAAALLVARAFPAIIVCPSSLKVGWTRELQHLVADLSVHVLEGFSGPIDAAHVVITNYELLRERERQLLRLGARCIVFDEGQVLKEPEPNSEHRAAIATRLAKTIGLPVVLTGTPMPNDARELWRLLHLVDPLAWPSFEDFKKRYCLEPERDDLLVGRQIVTEYARVHNVGELQTRMQPFMLRRLKSNVLDTLPPKARRTVLVELEPGDRASYDRAAQDFIAWYREVQGTQPASATQGQALLKIQMLRRIAAVGKLRRAIPRYLHAWFERTRPKPLVVFGYHQAVLRGVRAICDRLGLRVATIKGTDTGEKRMREVDAFNGGAADVFVAPIKAAGVGLNLQARASDVLFVERIWVPYAMSQAEDRVHRIGQSQAVTITYLDAARTVDEHVAKVVAAKQHVIDQVIDDRNEPDRQRMQAETIEEVIASFAGA